ncbi:MAG: hypothetical protein ACAI25_18050 [Planctomycetota bacterium]
MARKAKEKEIRLTVRVPKRLLEALDQHGSLERNGAPGKKVSRTQAVKDVLARALEDGGAKLKALMLRQLIVNTVRATEHHGATTLATVRELLANVPRTDLDQALYKLEQENSLLLTPNHNGDIVTSRERSNGIQDPVRGNLLYAQLTDDEKAEESQQPAEAPPSTAKKAKGP